MMEERMIVAGEGGQGLMTLGKVMAQAAMDDGLDVTWYPSYGAEVRGGTAHCHVVVSDRPIYSPLVEEATALLVMNGPSLARFAPRLVEGGLLVLNTSLVDAPADLAGTVVEVGATDMANALGNIRVANMIMLGALNARRKIFSEKSLAGALATVLGDRRKGLLDANLTAYRKGRELGK